MTTDDADHLSGAGRGVAAPEPMTTSCLRLRRWWLYPVAVRECRDLQRRAAAVTRGLGLEPGYGPAEICWAVSAYTGRHVRLRQLGDGVSALAAGCVREGPTDYVVIGSGVSPVHRLVLMLHAVGHLVLDHQGGPLVVSAWLRHALITCASIPTTPPPILWAFSDLEEIAAELFATQALNTITTWRPPAQTTIGLGQMYSALE